MSTRKQRLAAARARAAKKLYQKRMMASAMPVSTSLSPIKVSPRRMVGGFLPGLVAGLASADQLAKRVKPLSAIRDLGNAFGLSLPKNKVGNFLGKIGSYLIDKQGYGLVRMRRKVPRMMRRYR